MVSSTTSGPIEEAPGRRKLIAVVYADMVGYSRLIELDDAGTIKRLRALRSNLIDPAIDEHGGRLVQTGGDSLLIAFDSVDGAVRCAIKVQQQLPKFDSDQPPDRAIRFRIGINFGDVIADGTDLHGDMVNVAARLQAECPVGAICITRAVRDHVQHRLDLDLEELGPLKLKNIARPIEAFVLRLNETAAAQKPRDRLPPQDLGNTSQPAGQSTAGVVDALGGPASGTYRHSRPSIAVLPFLEYDPRAEQSYFGDGMIEDVVAALAALPDLFVISRASTLRYRGYAPNIKAIAGDLGVRYILSGSFRRREGRLRIAAELADAETQAVIEPYKVEGDTVDLFRLQDILVEQVVQRISPAIRGAELRRIRRKRPENFDAYDYLLRGLDLLYRLDRDEFNQARQMFQRAIQLDDNYAAPYAFGALWHSIRIGQGWSSDRAADMMTCEELASAAVLRDPTDVWALALSGHLRALLFRDFDSAFDLFERALHASPNSAFAWSRSSPAFSYIGDAAEARHRAEEALRLSPFDPGVFFTHCALGLAAYTEGDYATAVSWGRRSYAKNPLYTANLRFLVASLAANGQIEDARRIGENLRRLEPGFTVRKWIETYAYRDCRLCAGMSRHLLLAGLPE
jgi:adenylate cyclase